MDPEIVGAFISGIFTLVAARMAVQRHRSRRDEGAGVDWPTTETTRPPRRPAEPSPVAPPPDPPVAARPDDEDEVASAAPQEVPLHRLPQLRYEGLSGDALFTEVCTDLALVIRPGDYRRIDQGDAPANEVMEA